MWRYGIYGCVYSGIKVGHLRNRSEMVPRSKCRKLEVALGRGVERSPLSKGIRKNVFMNPNVPIR